MCNLSKHFGLLAMAGFLSFFLAFTPMAWAKYNGGTGEPNDPYRIANAEDLNDIGNHQEDWDKHFILVNDVNLAEYTGTLFRIIGNTTTKFTGVFDGNDHKVWSFTWSSTGRNYIGLFGWVGIGGKIKNLGMENVNVTAETGNCVGGLVGFSVDGTIINCYATGNVSGGGLVGGLVGENWPGTITDSYSIVSVLGTQSSVGGLVGYNQKGTITDCYSTGNISGEAYVGGLVGYNNYYSTITNCYSTGIASGVETVGGLVGHNSYGEIANCYSTVSVSGTGWGVVGGLVGRNWYAWGNGITNCYSTGGVLGNNGVGGLVGTSYFAMITNSYSAGIVVGNDYIGGLVGYNGFSTLINSYSACKVVGQENVGGLVGYRYNKEAEITASFWDTQTSGEPNSAGGTGKTTAEMKTIDTFIDAGWDFVEIWGIGENQTYPYLRTEPAGDSNHDKKVDLVDLAILASHWLEENQ